MNHSNITAIKVM